MTDTYFTMNCGRESLSQIYIELNWFIFLFVNNYDNIRNPAVSRMCLCGPETST